MLRQHGDCKDGRCRFCISFENDLPIVVASNPTIPLDLARLWPSVKHFD